MIQPHAAPPRVLGTLDATCIVIGAIIGVGIFFTPSRVAALTGDGGLALLAWTIGGAIALCGALTFGALGARYHASGAQYEILRDAYGPSVGFIFVFCNATAIQAGAIGVIAVVCAQYLALAVGAPPLSGAPLLAAAGTLIAGIAAANIAGVRWGARLQNFTVLAKILTLLAVTALGAFLAPNSTPPRPAPAPPSSAFSGILAALVPAFFAYGGWQHALWISGEVKDPRRTLPRAIVGGVLIVVTVYLLANWAYLRLLGVNAVASSKTLAADAVAAVFPAWGGRAVAVAVAVSAFGVLNAQLLSGPRLVYGMARDGRFFELFARLTGRAATPAAAILLLAVMGILALAATVWDEKGLDHLLAWAVLVDGIFFILTGAAYFILRRKPKVISSSESPSLLREGLGWVPSTPIPAPQAGVGLATPAQPTSISHQLTPLPPHPPTLAHSHSRTLALLNPALPGLPLAPALFVIGELAIVIGAFLNPATRAVAWIGLAWIAAAAVLYTIKFRPTPHQP